MRSRKSKGPHLCGPFDFRVLRGDRVVITRRGKKVAMLVPVDQETGANARAAGERLRALREGVVWGGEDGVTIRDAVEDGRR